MNRYGTLFRMLLVVACSLILAAVMTGSAAAQTDVYLGVYFHSFTLDGGNDTCVDFYDDEIDGWTRNCDPVNLVFPGRTWTQVRDLLLTDSWSLNGGGSNQWLHYNGSQLYVEDEQLYKPGGLFGPRYHIRLWQAPGNTLVTFAAVHHEDFIHNIDMDWEQAEAYVGSALCGPDCGQTGLLPQQFEIQGYDDTWRTNADETRHWINDGSATVIPAPGPPEPAPVLTATVASDTQIDLSWSDSDNEDAYEVLRQEDGQGTWDSVANLAADVTSYSDTGLTPNTTYHYEVRASNTFGTATGSDSATTDDTPPSATEHTATGEIPVAGTVSGTYLDTQALDGANQSITERHSGGKPSNRHDYAEHKWLFNLPPSSTMVAFHLNAMKSSSGDNEEFRFEYSTDDTNYTILTAVNSSVAADYAVQLAAPVSGVVYVRVVDTDQTPTHNNNETISVNYLAFVAESGPVQPPSSPTNLVATAVGFDAIDLAWMEAFDNETGFEIERSGDGVSYSYLSTVDAGVTTFSDTGPLTGTTYHYQVRAIFPAGPASDYSNAASATTFTYLHVNTITSASYATGRSGKWRAEVTITVHAFQDINHLLADGVNAEGVWSNGATGTGSCVTGSAGLGTCIITLSGIRKNVASVQFDLTGLSRGDDVYVLGDNHISPPTVTVNAP